MNLSIQHQIQLMASGAAVQADAGLLESLDGLALAYVVEGGLVRLRESVELLDRELIRAGLGDRAAGTAHELEVFWEIDSTNTYLMDRVALGDFHGRVCLGEQQLAGRGRRGREWVSPFGKNLYLSIGWKFDTRSIKVGGLSLVVGMAVVTALRSVGLKGVGLKWPNDVYLDDRKLAGILIEMAVPHRGEARVVVGIGVNVIRDPDVERRIDQPFSAVSDQVSLGRNRLAVILLEAVFAALEQFQALGFGAYQRRWPEFDIYAEAEVTVILSDQSVVGINQGIDAEGNLCLLTDQGVKAFNAGEVSLRRKTR